MECDVDLLMEFSEAPIHAMTLIRALGLTGRVSGAAASSGSQNKQNSDPYLVSQLQQHAMTPLCDVGNVLHIRAETRIRFFSTFHFMSPLMMLTNVSYLTPIEYQKANSFAHLGPH